MAQGRETSAATITACYMHNAGFLDVVSIDRGSFCCNSYLRATVDGGLDEAAFGREPDKG